MKISKKVATEQAKTEAPEIIRAAVKGDVDWDNLVNQIDHKELGQALAKRRLESGARANAIASAIGTDKTRVCRLENGGGNWTLELVVKYLAACIIAEGAK